MSQSVELEEARDGTSAEGARLELTIYQIVDDGMLKQNRDRWHRVGLVLGQLATRLDGRHARPVRLSLPAAHDRQSDGPLGHEPGRFHSDLARQREPREVSTSQFDRSADVWKKWISNEFGLGIITWNTPFLFRTKPEGSRLLICGPANDFKANAHPLTAIIESDWITMSFTMNWKIMKPGEPVRFEVGEPLFQAIPLVSNACPDLEGAS